MRIGKLVAAVLFLSMAVSASGQDLAAAARKERARRAALKNKTSATVNNDDLAKVKKKASVELPPQTDVQLPPVEGELEGAPPEAAPKPSAVPAEPGKGANVAEEEADAEIRRAGLQDKYERAKKDVELYTLKMRALQQQFYSFNTMQSKAQVQQEIADTNVKLLAATAEEAALKKQLDESNAKYPIKK